MSDQKVIEELKEVILQLERNNLADRTKPDKSKRNDTVKSIIAKLDQVFENED